MLRFVLLTAAAAAADDDDDDYDGGDESLMMMSGLISSLLTAVAPLILAAASMDSSLSLQRSTQLQNELEMSIQKNAQLQNKLERSIQKNLQVEYELERSIQKNSHLENELERSIQKNSHLENELQRSIQKNAQLENELERSRQQIVQLQKQLEDVKFHCHVQNADVCNQNDVFRSKLSELEALLLAVPPNPSLCHPSFAQCSTSVVRGKNRRNEQFLRDLFNRHKDVNGGLSGQNLVQSLCDAGALNIPTTDQEIADFIKQYDANSNGALEFGEFQQAVNEPDQLQMWFGEKQLPLAADALRPLVGCCSDQPNQLRELSQLPPTSIDQAAAVLCSVIPGMLNELHKELHDSLVIQSSIEASMKADPTKFNDFCKMACGSIADFHLGLTGRVGMPHLNFKDAMRQEHCERAGCGVEFTTGNYKITTTPKQEWQYVVESCPCPDMGYSRRIVSIIDLQQRQVSRDAKLCEEEVIAIVLYTGPMFQIYNTILRRYPADKYQIFKDGDNLFSTTIFVLVSAVQKLSRFTRIPLGTLLYRGLGGKIDLPDIFFQVDDTGCSGYAEWGFLSTTSDRDIALSYSGVKQKRPKAMVMVIETSSIDRGADISEFSQYPGEQEFLYLPCSFVQRTRPGSGRVQVVDGALVTFVSVRVNLNIKTQTVEELQEQKKLLHMVSAKCMLTEVKFELTSWTENCRMQGIDLTQYVGNVTNFCDDIMRTCQQLVEFHEQRDTRDFCDDEKFRQMINAVLDAKSAAIDTKKWHQSRIQLRSHDFKTFAHRMTVTDHSNHVKSVSFHPTAPFLATASSDGTAKIWRFCSDGSAATCVETLSDLMRTPGQYLYTTFHPSAPIFATGASDGMTRLYRVSSETSSVTFLGQCSSSSCSVAFHSTAPVFATGSKNTASLWSFPPDSKVCVDRHIRRKKTLEGHNGTFISVAFHPTAPILATGSNDGTTKLWRLSSDNSTASCVATLEDSCLIGNLKVSVAFHPTASMFATTYTEGAVKLWLLWPDCSAASCVQILTGHVRAVTSVAFHPTAPFLATSSDDSRTRIWRLHFSRHDDDFGLAIDRANKVEMLDGFNKNQGHIHGHKDSVRCVSFHPTAPLLATASDDGTAKIWQMG